MKMTFVLLSVLKKRAKQLQNEKSLNWCHALDEAAKEVGYSNYKHYKNVAESGRNHYKTPLEQLHENLSLENDINKRMQLVITFMNTYDTPFRDLLVILKLFEGSHGLGEHPDFDWLDDVHFVSEKLAFMKDEIRTYLLDDFLTEEGAIEIDDIYPYYQAKKLSISDITYEIREDALYADGNYCLTIEPVSDEFEAKNKDYGTQERQLSGSFGITIDANKLMTIEHADIGRDFRDFYVQKSIR